MHATPPNPASPSYGIAYSLGAQVSHHLMTLPRPRHLHTAHPRDFDRLSIYLDHSKKQNSFCSYFKRARDSFHQQHEVAAGANTLTVITDLICLA